MKKIVFFSICLFFISTLFGETKATTAKINEILANPSEGDKEFVELYSEDISDFSNYYLKDKVGTKKTLENLQNCASYFVWELSASSGEGWLNNSGEESVFLYDQSDNLVDSYENWESSEENKSLSRIPDTTGEWQETENTKCAENQAPSPSPTPQSSPSPQTTTPSPQASPKSTAKPAVSSKKSPSPSPKPTDNQAKNVLGEKTEVSTPSANLGMNLQDSPPPTAGYTQESSQKIAGIFIGVGSVLVAISLAVYLWYKRLQDKPTINKEKDRFQENKIED